MGEYLDLDLVVGNKVEGEYPITVDTPQWGDLTASMRFDPSSLADHLARIDEDAVSRETLEEVGTLLFDALLPRDVTAALMVSLGHARSIDAGLRIRLRLEPVELRPIPWEFLYVPFFHRLLGADTDISLTRSVAVFGEVIPLPTDLPLRILVVAPQGSGLNTEKEIGNLEKALEPLGSSVVVDMLDGIVTLNRLGDALEADTFHVFHFIGHGKLAGTAGHLEINNGGGGPEGLSEDQLRALFDIHDSMKLAVLNACEGGATLEAAKAFSGIAPNLVAAGVPAVVAHQYPVTDKAAITFSRALYRALVRGPNPGMIEDAVARARNQLSIEFPGNRVVGATVLYMRGPSGRLFTMQPPTQGEIDEVERAISAKDAYVESLRADAIPFATHRQQQKLEEEEANLAALRIKAEELRSKMPD